MVTAASVTVITWRSDRLGRRGRPPRPPRRTRGALVGVAAGPDAAARALRAGVGRAGTPPRLSVRTITIYAVTSLTASRPHRPNSPAGAMCAGGDPTQSLVGRRPRSSTVLDRGQRGAPRPWPPALEQPPGARHGGDRRGRDRADRGNRRSARHARAALYSSEVARCRVDATDRSGWLLPVRGISVRSISVALRPGIPGQVAKYSASRGAIAAGSRLCG
jgi:hypothetical protein